MLSFFLLTETKGQTLMKDKTWRKDKLGKSHLQSSLDVQVKWFGCDVPWVYCQLTKEKNKPCM